jgi:hypothetical protein
VIENDQKLVGNNQRLVENWSMVKIGENRLNMG